MERTDESDLGVAVDQADAEAGARANKVRGEKNFILAVGVVVVEEKLDRVTICRLQKDAPAYTPLPHFHSEDPSHSPNWK